MILSATPFIDDHIISDFRGSVAGKVILEANIIRDLFAAVTDIVGGRSTKYEQELSKARHIAIQEMADQAQEPGANAVIGIDLDY